MLLISVTKCPNLSHFNTLKNATYTLRYYNLLPNPVIRKGFKKGSVTSIYITYP